jgi:hypothetical protein
LKGGRHVIRLFTKKDKRSKLDIAIDDLADRMKVMGPDDTLYPEYARMMVDLQKAKACEKPKVTLDINTLLNVAAYLIGIGAVLWFEQSDNVIHHKSTFGMASRWKL